MKTVQISELMQVDMPWVDTGHPECKFQVRDDLRHRFSIHYFIPSYMGELDSDVPYIPPVKIGIPKRFVTIKIVEETEDYAVLCLQKILSDEIIEHIQKKRAARSLSSDEFDRQSIAHTYNRMAEQAERSGSTNGKSYRCGCTVSRQTGNPEFQSVHCCVGHLMQITGMPTVSELARKVIALNEEQSS